MCTYINETTRIFGSAKGPSGWIKVDTANVYFDHPYHAPLDHALGIDFVDESSGSPERVAVEISAESARRLVAKILAALESGEAAHAIEPEPAEVEAQRNRRAGRVEVNTIRVE